MGKYKLLIVLLLAMLSINAFGMTADIPDTTSVIGTSLAYLRLQECANPILCK